MESKSQKQSTNGEKTSSRLFKKNLAVATMVASLGVSLGVPVSDALADNERMSSPPGYSRQDNQDVASEQMKFSNQTKISNQAKWKSSQGKIESSQSKLESSQGKIESSQIKLDKQIETENIK